MSLHRVYEEHCPQVLLRCRPADCGSRCEWGGILYFLHGDHLGSATLTTDINGNRIGELRYTPYGEMRRDYPRGVIPTDRLYTGQRQETFGLYDYRARYYHPALGRFVSADPLVPEPGTPGPEPVCVCLQQPAGLY